MAVVCKKCDNMNSNPNFTLCPRCRKNKNWKYWDKRLLEGMCLNTIKCPNKRIKNSSNCQDCMTKMYDQLKGYNKRLSDKGLCTVCRTNKHLKVYENKPDGVGKMCRACYLKKVAVRYLLSKDYWKQLLEMLKGQDFRCVYSGEVIILGENDSLDHIIPQKQCPEKKYDITNMQWTIRDVNSMKTTLNEQRFFDLLTKILENCKNRRHFISSSY